MMVVSATQGYEEIDNKRYMITRIFAIFAAELLLVEKHQDQITNVNSGDAGIGYGGPGNGSAHARRLGDI